MVQESMSNVPEELYGVNEDFKPVIYSSNIITDANAAVKGLGNLKSSNSKFNNSLDLGILPFLMESINTVVDFLENHVGTAIAALDLIKILSNGEFFEEPVKEVDDRYRFKGKGGMLGHLKLTKESQVIGRLRQMLWCNLS